MKKTRKTLYAMSLGMVICICSVFGLTACENEHEHTYGEWSVTDEATCTQAGERKKSCSCGDSVTEEITALGHTYGELVARVEAACSDAGFEAHYFCDVCDTYFTSEKAETTADALTVAANADLHQFGTWVEEVPATCSAEGTKGHKACSACNKNYDINGVEITDLTLSALDHDYGSLIERVAPTCIAKGMEAYYFCNACDTYFTEEKTETTKNDLYIEPSSEGHFYSEWIAEVAASCSFDGKKGFKTCYYCLKNFDENGTEITDLTIPAHGHEFGEPTYTWADDNSYCTAKCVCIYDDNHVNEVTLYSTSEVTQNKSCTLDELTTYTAAFTASSFETQIKENVKTADKSGHTYGEWVDEAPATCTSEGTMAHKTCSACNKNYDINGVEIVDLTISAHGHSYGTPTYVWSADSSICTATRVCSHNSAHTESETAAITGIVTQNKSCTDDELTTYTATFTNSAFETQIKENVKTADKLGHDEIAHDAQSPTCFAKGCSAYVTCSRCDYSTYQEIAATGHSYVNEYCSVCGEHTPTEGLTYSLNSDKSSYSLSYSDSYTDTDIYVASIYEGLPVTAVGGLSFWLNSTVESITLPESITLIDMSAFSQCTSLKSVSLPNSLITIGEYAFSGCTALESIVLPDSVTTLGANAFEGCSALTSITLGDNLETIGEKAFYGCSVLTSIVIPDSATSIGSYAFYNCTALTSVTLSASLTEISEYAFAYCRNLKSVTVPESVTSIGKCAFYYCTYLDNIALPKTLTEIGNNAFDYCIGVTTVTYGDTLAQWKTLTKGDNWISSNAEYVLICTDTGMDFEGNLLCSVSSYTAAHTFENGICSSCGSLQTHGLVYKLSSDGSYYTVSGVGECTDTDIYIPSVYMGIPVTHIGNNAFYECASLKSVTLPDSVVNIGTSAFFKCKSLKSFLMSDNVSRIGESAFYQCSALESINISASLTYISTNVFYYCTSLTSIVLSDSVNSISSTSFIGCSGLTSVTMSSAVTYIGSRGLYNCSGLTTITFKGTMAQWKAITKSSYWNTGTGEYTVVCTDGTLDKDENVVS